MRRVLTSAAAALTAVLLLPTSAHADQVVTFESPAPDEILEEPTPIELRVERRLIDPHPETVTVRLSVDGTEPHAGSEQVALDCVENCEGDPSQTTTRWRGPDLRPSTLAPFGDVPACNGRWWLLPQVNPGQTARADGAQGSFVVSLPPRPVTVEATVDGDEVLLVWQRAAEDDIVRYRVERRVSGSTTWGQVADLGSASRQYRDAPGDGRFEYRVVTVRPDGIVDGEPVAPCTDRGTDLTTASTVWRVELDGSRGSATPTENTVSGEGTEEPEDGSGTADDPRNRDRDGDGDGDDEDGDDRSTAAAARSGSSPRSRISASGGSSVTAPDVRAEGGSDPDDRYFGENGPFSEELDYGEFGPIAGDEEYGVERVSGGVIEIFDRELDLEHALRPVASGMVLVAFGLHLRRWVRATD